MSPTNRFGATSTAARLDMLDPRSSGVQGAWWPRTRDLGSELADLNDLLVCKHGLMHSVTYAASDWDGTETGQVRATRAGSFVRLTTSATFAPHTLLIQTLHNTRIRLLVIPSTFCQGQADRAVQILLRSNGRCSAEEILHLCHSA